MWQCLTLRPILPMPNLMFFYNTIRKPTKNSRKEYMEEKEAQRSIEWHFPMPVTMIIKKKKENS